MAHALSAYRLAHCAANVRYRLTLSVHEWSGWTTFLDECFGERCQCVGTNDLTGSTK